jgi:Sigma-70, region 4
LPLILCYLEGRTQEEVAQHLGCSGNTLRRRLDEARQALGRRLRRRGLAWTVALSAVLISDCAGSASLPMELVEATIDAGIQITAGNTARVVASLKVTALAEGVMKAMLFSKLKTVAVLLLAAAACSGWAVYKFSAPATTNSSFAGDKIRKAAAFNDESRDAKEDSKGQRDLGP